MFRIWRAFGAVMVVSFAILGWTGLRIYQEAPPIPERVVTSDGQQVVGSGESSMRTNRFDPETRILTIEPLRARAFRANAEYYRDVFSNGRSEYAIPQGALSDPQRIEQLSAFIFWTSWAASTNRPGEDVTYTSNGPHEPLIGNQPTGEALVCTGVSIIVLLAGIGAMAFWYATQKQEVPLTVCPQRGVLADRAHADIALGPRARRHCVRDRRSCSHLVRGGLERRLVHSARCRLAQGDRRNAR